MNAPAHARLPLSPLRRRTLLQGAALATLGAPFALRAAPSDGRTLVLVQSSEPLSLTNALSTEGNIYTVSGKLFDGLVTFDRQLRPQPRLAREWAVAKDGLAVTFRLRPGVTWHDGQPFTSADVAFSVLEIWKKYNGRGRSTFANVEAVDTPDALTAVLRLSKPAPYLLAALSSFESQVVPKHVYAGSEPLTNAKNAAPVGSGPFRFARRQRGSHITLERNPTYWDAGKPQVDRLIIRIVPDLAAAAATLEAGEAHIGVAALSNIARLKQNRLLEVHEMSDAITANTVAFEFNLDRPQFRDVRVRRAFAHAIDRAFILKNVYHGYGTVAEAPLPRSMSAFFTDDVPKYPLDLKRAEALLDEAGFRRDAQGTRMTIRCDPNPNAETTQVAQVLRSAFARIGVRLEVRAQDFAEYVNRIYTRRDFDTAIIAGSAGPDPAIGTQRWYWSKNFKPGVAFSNGAHYVSEEADRALEGAQTEIDPAKRRALYDRFQQIVQTDLPRITLVAPSRVVVSHKGARDFVDGEGIYGNFANAKLLGA